jgi:hypothetical protein
MFNSFSGSFTVFDSEGVTLSSAIVVSNGELKGFRAKVTIGAVVTEYEITDNTTEKIYFTNSIALAGTISIEYVTRGLLTSFESDLSSVLKVADALLTNKIENVKKYFNEKLKSQFRFLFDFFPDDDNPLDRIINLGEIQTAFCYYLLSEIYTDLLLSEGDINEYKSKLFMNKYKDVVEDALSRLSYRRDGETSLESEDVKEAKNKGRILSR